VRGAAVARQRQREGRAATFIGDRVQLAAVQACQRACDVQTQAVTAPAGTDAMETVEQLRDLPARDAAAVIGYAQPRSARR
jgi:hypothetical protein